MAKCNGNHNMVTVTESRDNCVEDPQSKQKTRKVTVRKECSNEDCNASGVEFYWENC